MRLLVVDDKPANHKVVVAMLARLGFGADVAANGKEAVEAFRLTTYSAILMDCHMPVMDGYEATSSVRTLEQGASRVPIIAVTASPIADTREKCLAAGMDDYLAKPIAMDELRVVLERWIGIPDSTAEPPTAPATAPPAARIFDARRVAALRGIEMSDTPDPFKHFAMMFLEEAVEQITALDEALTAGNVERARHEAHTLRGGAATMGAEHLEQLCAVLEERVIDGEPTAAGALALVRIELDRVGSSLDRLPPWQSRSGR